MPLDFRADQIQVGKLIPSASNGTNAKLLIYSASADAAPYNQGNINSARFNTSAIGTDTFIYISGTRATSATTLAASTSKAVFGGDIHASGSIVVEGFDSGDQNVLIIGNRTISTPNNVSNNTINISPGTKNDGGFGGSVRVFGGDGINGTNTSGGNITLAGGTGGSTTGNGGNATLVGGQTFFGQGPPSTGNGGNVYIGGGLTNNSNTYGYVSIGEKSAVGTSFTKFVGVNLDAANHITGSDKSFIVSGTVNGRRTGGRNVAVFEGDLVVSGNLYVSSSISGSHHKLYNGLDFLVAGSNITITTGTNGQVTISSTGGGGGGNQWIEGVPSPRQRTTASVSISSLSEFAQDKGSDIWFWVSGTQAANTTELTQSMGRKAVFGGDVLHSGSVIIQGLASGQNKLLLSAGSISTPSYISSNDLNISVGEKSSGTGGGLTLSAGNSPASGGQVIISAGNGTGTGESTGGLVSIYSGYGSDSGDGGSVNIIAANGGDAVTVTSAGNGGDVTIGAGNGGVTANGATSSGRGGNLTLYAGNSNNYESNPVASGGGSVSITAGQGATGLTGNSPGGDGGTISIIAGPSGYADGTGDLGYGGNVLISAGYNASANNHYAGYVGIGDKVASVTKFVHVGLDSSTDLITGSDGFFIVSGAVNGRNNGLRGVAVFKGDVVISGNLYVSSSISGSHHKLYNGQDFLVAGSNITITTGTNGQVTISSAGGGGGGGNNQWVEGTPSPRLRTTASVSISSLSEFAQDKGADVWFYVSGTKSDTFNDLTSSFVNQRRSVFGGDVVVSGAMSVGGLGIVDNKLLLGAGTISTPGFITNNNLDISVGEKSIGGGGDLTLSAGDGYAQGGQVIVRGGNATTGPNNGGSVSIFGGTPYGGGNGSGGDVYIAGAPGADSVTPSTSGGPGGAINIVAGHGGNSNQVITTAGYGGSINIQAGDSNTYVLNSYAAYGGSVNIQAGQGATALSGDNPAGDGGTITIIAGPTGLAAGAGDVGFGGNVLISAGYNANSNNDRAGYIGLGDKVTSVTKFVHVGLDSTIDLITGSDQFFIVSGTVNGRRTGGRNVAVFQGDVVISGNLYVSSSISGSHHKLYNGLDFLVAGNNVTIITGTNGQVTISATTGSSSGSVTLPTGSLISLGLVDYKSSNATDSSPEAVGQYSLDTNLYTGSIYARFTLATTNAAYSASIQLANISLGQLVEIGGPGITKLTTNNTTPTLLQSVDLKTAGNFTSGEAIYEVRVFTQNSSAQAVVGGGEFRVTASLASSIPTIQYVSGSGFPDSPLPRMEWLDTGLVSIVSSVNNNVALDYWKKPIRITFQDGIQRVYSSSNLLDVMFITSTVVGPYGLDRLSSMQSRGGDQWYYVYLIPSGSNNGTEKLSIIASTSAPSGVFGTDTYGPDGYTNFRYIGPLFYKTTGKGVAGIEVFKQNDSKTFIFNNGYQIYSTNSTMDANISQPTTAFNLMTTPTFPPSPTVSKIFGDLVLNMSGAVTVDSVEHQIFTNGGLSAFTSPTCRTRVNGPYRKSINPVVIPVGYVREYHSWAMNYRTIQDSTAWPATAAYTASLQWTGFEDQYLTDYIQTNSLTGSIGGQINIGGGGVNVSSQPTILLANTEITDLGDTSEAIVGGDAYFATEVGGTTKKLRVCMASTDGVHNVQVRLYNPATGLYVSNLNGGNNYLQTTSSNGVVLESSNISAELTSGQFYQLRCTPTHVDTQAIVYSARIHGN